MSMEVVYWSEKVERFIKNLDSNTAFRAKNSVDLLREHGHLIDMPDSKSLGKGLFELRIQGKIKVRFFYIFHRDKAYLIHGFVKKSWKIPIRDILYARKIQMLIIGLA